MQAAGKIKYRGVFVCSSCGANKYGETESIEVGKTSRESLMAVISNIQPKSFPVGWASFPDKFLCAACLLKEKK